ncbi:hypothetical protein [Caulobacter henricii]|uniref:Uncharacterized protein n=1 Tax=Caulobacter henricii TaxID=69395 RepID=A0A0P0P0V0_9CAUL|nr:hypothetical protein [Caulobacter henricii]ALL14085.1 hypothetical protein AQ619_12445 [Caulobacter henricii]
MYLLLLALAQGPAPQEAQAALQSCEMTSKGWVCHYQIPSVTVVRPLDAAATSATPGETTSATPPAAAPDTRPSADKADSALAARQARLIANCADATWLSLCLPGDRREAKILREAAQAAATLRGKVTALLSESRCDEAVKTALAGGNMALAREARDFCKP